MQGGWGRGRRAPPYVMWLLHLPGIMEEGIVEAKGSPRVSLEHSVDMWSEASCPAILSLGFPSVK